MHSASAQSHILHTHSITHTQTHTHTHTHTHTGSTQQQPATSLPAPAAAAAAPSPAAAPAKDPAAEYAAYQQQWAAYHAAQQGAGVNNVSCTTYLSW